MLDLTLDEKQLRRNIEWARERNIIIPTFKQQCHPKRFVPLAVEEKLKDVGLSDIHPSNLFRITWRNERKEQGGGFGLVNRVELPGALTGVRARIIALVGKYFPTGAPEAGAAFGCLVPKFVTGQFDPARQEPAWEGSRNFCRAGAYCSTLLGCRPIAILNQEAGSRRIRPSDDSPEEVISVSGHSCAPTGFLDECAGKRMLRPESCVMDELEELGNYLWHYAVTGRAVEDVLEVALGVDDHLGGVVLGSDAAGTLGCADYVKARFPTAKLAVGETTRSANSVSHNYGGRHRENDQRTIVPWIRDTRNTDMTVTIEHDHCVRLLRLFNEPAGRLYLADLGVSTELVTRLGVLGFSGIAGLVGAVIMARYYEMGETEVVLTVSGDSAEQSSAVVAESVWQRGEYNSRTAETDRRECLLEVSKDRAKELGYYDRKRIHGLKHPLWIEKYGRDPAELDSQWSPYPAYWEAVHNQANHIDRLIEKFNRKVGLLDGP